MTLRRHDFSDRHALAEALADAAEAALASALRDSSIRVTVINPGRAAPGCAPVFKRLVVCLNAHFFL